MIVCSCGNGPHDCRILYFLFFCLSLYPSEGWQDESALSYVNPYTRRHRHTRQPPPLLTSTSSPTRPWGEAAWHQTVIQTLRQLCNKPERERERECSSDNLLISWCLNFWWGMIHLKRQNWAFVKFCCELFACVTSKVLLEIYKAY